MARWTGLFPPGKGGGDGVAYGGKGKGIFIHIITEGSRIPLSNRITPANGSERDQVIPLLDSLKVKTNKRGRPRKPLKVLAADKAYDSKDKRAALRRRGIRPQWPKGVWKTKKNKGRPIKISVPSDNKNLVSHGFKKNTVVLLSDGKEFQLVLMLFCLLQ
ncbi:hypothetical protein RintRC_2687 [Richelia intracellularis]|nr:hypothetical protein RintRC_2687 [Richelia intracellularis]